MMLSHKSTIKSTKVYCVVASQLACIQLLQHFLSANQLYDTKFPQPLVQLLDSLSLLASCIACKATSINLINNTELAIYTTICTYTSICDQIFQKGSYTRTISKHAFHCHLIVTSMDQQHMHLILLKVELLSFRSLSQTPYLTSMSARVAFKWPHLPLTSRQLTVIHHTTG